MRTMLTEDIKNRIKELLGEAKKFAEGNGDHLYYAKEEGSKLVVPTTKDIIDYLIKAARTLSNELEDLNKEVEKQIEIICSTFEQNYKSCGRDDEYLVKDEMIQIFGQEYCGG